MIRNAPSPNLDGSIDPSSPDPRVVLIRLGILLAILAAAFRDQLHAVVWQASRFSEWSHVFGWPAVALLYVLSRQTEFRTALRPGSVWGLALIFLGFAAWFAPAVTSQFGYAQLLGLCAGVGGVVLVIAGRRVFGLCVPLLLMLWAAMPLTERTMGSKTLGIQRISVNAAAMLLGAAPGLDAHPDGVAIAFRRGDRTDVIGVAEQRFGASLLPACMQVGLLTVFIRRRSPAVIALLLLALPPVALLSNVLRIVTWGLVAAYGGLDVTSTAPRNLSIAAALLITVAAISLAGRVLTGLGVFLSQLLNAEKDEPSDADAPDPMPATPMEGPP